MDNRGQAGSGVNFLLVVGAAAILGWVMSTATEPLLQHANDALIASDTVGSQGLTYATQTIEYWPVVAGLFAGVAYLISESVERGAYR